MAVALESLDVTATTDPTGYIDVTFASPFDQVFATGNTPFSGAGQAIVGVTAHATGANTARVYVWVALSGSVTSGYVVSVAKSVQVDISLLAVRHV